MQQIFDEVYATPGGNALRYDLFLPDARGNHPLVVLFHGGGWISGDKSANHEVAMLLASNGFAAASPSYRLAPLHPFPAAVEDAMTFVRFAKSNSEKLGIDSARIASFGVSAGGHLASMLGVLDRLPDYEPDSASARVKAVIDVCGITDVTNPAVKHLPISWSFLEQFMEVPFEGNEERYRLASPLCHVGPDSASFLVFHGEDDDIVPISQSEEFTDALMKAGANVEFHRYPCEGHSFSYGRWIEMADLSLKFLKENL